MTAEKFDGSIGRFASVASLVTLAFEAAKLYTACKEKSITVEMLLVYVGGILVVSVLVCYALVSYMRKKRKDLLDSAAKRASQFDYKYCSDVNATGIFNFLCGKEGCNIDLKKMKDPILINSSDSRYRSANSFYSDEHIMKSFTCTPLKNDSKKDKCILQVLYVPMDADGNVPVILRMPDQHSSAGEDEPQFTFVSFSPVPRRYGAAFDPLDCYHREVPSTPSCLEEYGMAVSKQKSSFYLFYIFIAKYENVHFAKDGAMNKDVMKDVFSVGDGKMFAKDHDEILHITTLENLYNAITQQNCADEVLVKLMAQRQKFVRMEEGKPYITFKFDLSKAKFKGVEEQFVKLEGWKNL